MSPRYPAPSRTQACASTLSIPRPPAGWARSSYAYRHDFVALGEQPREDELRRSVPSTTMSRSSTSIRPVGQFYEPVDLNRSTPACAGRADALRRQSAIPPADGLCGRDEGQSALFERALGRKVLWAPRNIRDRRELRPEYEPVKSCASIPMRCAKPNAYYSRQKRALLFGYFRSDTPQRPGRSWIFTALSHDIIAHETTHAVLDGLHPPLRRSRRASTASPFTKHSPTSSRCSRISPLPRPCPRTSSEVARIARPGRPAERTCGTIRPQVRSDERSLRQYVGIKPRSPNCSPQTTECHDRGAILVAAVFDAFLTIYQSAHG